MSNWDAIEESKDEAVEQFKPTTAVVDDKPAAASLMICGYGVYNYIHKDYASMCE